MMMEMVAIIIILTGILNRIPDARKHTSPGDAAKEPGRERNSGASAKRQFWDDATALVLTLEGERWLYNNSF